MARRVAGQARPQQQSLRFHHNRGFHKKTAISLIYRILALARVFVSSS